jgi:hypothetical protein
MSNVVLKTSVHKASPYFRTFWIGELSENYLLGNKI